MRVITAALGLAAIGGVGYLAYRYYRQSQLATGNPNNLANPGLTNPSNINPPNYVPPTGSEIPGVSGDTFTKVTTSLGSVAGGLVGGLYGGGAGAQAGSAVGGFVAAPAARGAVVGAKAHVSAITGSVKDAASGVKEIASGNIVNGVGKVAGSAVKAGLAPVTSTFKSIKSLF